MSALGLHRRSRLHAALVAAAAAVLVLTSCSSDSDDPDTANGTPEASAETDTYPVTVDTAYGEITVEEKPERIVALAGDYLEPLILLDEEPIAFVVSSRASIDDPLAGFPWLDGLVDPEKLDTGLTEGYVPVLEAVAAYEPDLILGYGAEWSIDEQMYEQMSQIAPTYTTPDFADQATRWKDDLHNIGALTANSVEAEEAIADFEAELDDARERLADLQGATVIGADSAEPATFAIFGASYLQQEIGLVSDTELLGDEDATATLSLENLDELTSDVILFQVFRADGLGADAVGREELEADPSFADLPAVQNGTVLWGDGVLTNASQSGSLGYSWYLEQVVSQLEDSALNTGG